MKKKLLLMLTLCLLAQWSVAQAPKWVDKAKRAVFSVVTYDQDDKILNTGNGFFVTEDGVALFYGTSILQGGCASRPGMAHTNIISRRLVP